LDVRGNDPQTERPAVKYDMESQLENAKLTNNAALLTALCQLMAGNAKSAQRAIEAAEGSHSVQKQNSWPDRLCERTSRGRKNGLAKEKLRKSAFP
jgi:hypothetical protein